ncbi:sterile alpha motif domain-containing protein 9-like [Cyprinodon tularosa]|uniref:sterile alpha motif domain-containing protein 9-like n=1 Tax=Cyprinodon tularosa TaxID=77115 RepID=UPI0018E20C2A|nr:sterile alpha motif domain-containing protein 9-like [Cyprinodon tularosa]XP_038153131.1 sterile alpha motif domain-containing protein 9-like [Cyprinodon tularosa]
MSQPRTEDWTGEDVHRWLMTKVKVSQSCADRFIEEEVSGEYLVSFEKKDILDLGIKHGPAVKIACYLKSLTEGREHQSEYPAYVESWSKDQVSQWLTEHVKIYSKYAQQLLNEDVSGDCLICFMKQDFLDLEVKSGPAVKILAQMKKLNNEQEPLLQPSTQTSVGQAEGDTCVGLESNLPHTLENKQDIQEKTGSQGPSKRTSIKTEEKRTEPEPFGPKHKVAVVNPQPQSPQTTIMIKNILDDLLKDDLKNFHFHLSEYTKSKRKLIPRGKLEGKDPMDTAQILTGHYGGQEALLVTKDLLQEINQRELALQLEKSIGQLEQPCLSRDIMKKEANQGDKLKNLLTCGGDSLESYNSFVIVVNKSNPQQVQYLSFLSKLKLFCVLDFDPNSVAEGGLCHSYRELRVANLHLPTQFQGHTEAVIKELNLYLQTSWVFCNGRNDLDDCRELDYRTWLRRSCKDLEQLVSLICNPDVLLHGRYLVIFLLLSPVHSEKDPVLDTYMSFIKHIDESNIISICESQKTYLEWRELIKRKCDFDIEHFSINELSLSEINGTIMGLGPVTQSSTRLLPSSGSSAVVLKQKDEDLLTALDVLCLNQCEKIYEERSSEFHDFRKTVEEEFYRGAKVRWWNFYFCDKNTEKPFIKREKYEHVKKMIRSQRTYSSNTCVLLTLFHDPGCGGTTLAMHVMWDLRKEFRCAVLKDNTVPKTEVANQVRHLMKLESEKPSPVLLLVDDSKETDNPFDLLICIRQAVEDLSDIHLDDAPNCKVIILNCVRSHDPKEQYRKNNQTQNQYLTAKLTPQEQKEFEKKLKELKETHDKPENFYSFMFMKNNFDRKYTENLAHNTLENFDFSTKEGKLLSFLALLNTYVTKSEMALSLCEDFFQMKMVRWKDDSVLDRMKPYSNFLIIESVDEWGGYKGIRILHHAIASACLEELERSHDLKASDIVMEILHYDLFFSDGVVKHRLMRSVIRMLVERQLKKNGEERELFSPLIDKIHSQQGRQKVQEIFVKASSRFEKKLSIPQALARYLYINVKDFPEAIKWAEKAKNIKENPYTFDTIGEIHKSNLRFNINKEKQVGSHNPDNLLTNIEIAKNGWKAFQRAQELADMENEIEEEAPDDESEDYPRNSYNIKGYVKMLEIYFLVFEILSRLPFFEEHDPMKKHYLRSFLNGQFPISNVHKENSDCNNRCVEIIKEHELFLVKRKEIKEIFDLLNNNFTYIKQNSELDAINLRIVSNHFKKYVDLFCSTQEEMKKEKENKTTLSRKLEVEDRKRFLEKNQADTFSGILQYLDKPAEEMEQITDCYAFILQNDTNERNVKTKINYIMANIVLHHLKPKSKHVKKYKELCTLLQEVLQDVGLRYPFPDPYFLAQLLFWPSPTEENIDDITKYVKAIRKSSHKHLSKLLHKRSTVAYFYLGQEDGLRGLVSKPSLDKSFLPKMNRDVLAQLWRDGDIFKEEAIKSRLYRVKGTIEQGEVYANYRKQRIPVRTARTSAIRSGFSTEKVSFYIGFAINGPLAYNIKYEN